MVVGCFLHFTIRHVFCIAGQFVDGVPLWPNVGGQTNPLQDGLDIDMDYGQHFAIHRNIRSTDNNDTAGEEGEDLFTNVSEFYSDKNNLAMYLVLPLIVVVYGGCSTIYCVAKCRQYLRKRKHKQMSEPQQPSETGSQVNINENAEPSPLQDDNMDKSGKDCKRSITSAADISCGVGGSSSTPLPWQVPDEDSYQEDDSSPHNKDDVIIPPRPQSNIHKHSSVGNESSRPGTSASLQSNWLDMPPVNARNSVNSNTEEHAHVLHQDPDVIPASEKRLASREDDQVSLDVQNNTGKFSRASTTRATLETPQSHEKGSSTDITPLESTTVALNHSNHIKPSDEHMGSVSVAKQAAQLLRVELQNKRGISKKQKRLVFVAE